ncbi:phosphomevalonate kinase [Apostasia shenzhenica]|uniref:Phosphomevalonate kinase n=1 Tax=Apostasia shenzhenica TaxID=1088818 RepID=A0A2I0ABY9_9ASPA|nr:phosphomevalonate kinase [Apostasia shenzhenica]
MANREGKNSCLPLLIEFFKKLNSSWNAGIFTAKPQGQQCNSETEYGQAIIVYCAGRHARVLVASAPGKVLITGGYLILDKPNAGLVLSTNSRFYAIVKPLSEEIKPESWAWVFYSPVFMRMVCH